MFGDKKRNGAGQKGPLLTVLGESARLEGKFTIQESIQIECEVAGEINVEGRLVIGDKGIVRADVNTVDALIRGHYEGKMVATGNVEITSTGRVSGNIETDSLVISKGGLFNGNVSKLRHAAEIAAEHHQGSAAVEPKPAARKPA
jgi:cytoskeletal protein CcmA (bactofilin family)